MNLTRRSTVTAHSAHASHHMRRIVKYILVFVAIAIGAAVALFLYAVHEDQQRFREAQNDCERNCLQDSGGLMQCREICTHHPNHYDNP